MTHYCINRQAIFSTNYINDLEVCEVFNKDPHSPVHFNIEQFTPIFQGRARLISI